MLTDAQHLIDAGLFQAAGVYDVENASPKIHSRRKIQDHSPHRVIVKSNGRNPAHIAGRGFWGRGKGKLHTQRPAQLG